MMRLHYDNEEPFLADRLHDARWRAVGIGAAMVTTDPYASIGNHDTVIILIVGEDPNG